MARRSGAAAYLRLVHQVKQALRLGLLQTGDRLPTAKEVVSATAVNPNTVLKANRELEREGLVEARRGLRTFIARSLARDATAAGGSLRAELAAGRFWPLQSIEAGSAALLSVALLGLGAVAVRRRLT